MITVLAGIFFTGPEHFLNAQFRFDPRLKWYTIKTNHCAIHYSQCEDSLARTVAAKAEKYYAVMREIFHYSPRSEIQIVFDNSSDIIFDAATPLPHLQVFLNPTSTALGLGHYEDWLDLVIAHEFVHTFDIDKTGGISDLLRITLGRLYFPGIFGPQWLTEGIATFIETEVTEGGRGIDPYYDMFLRMAFLEGRVLTADQASSFLVQWPEGISAYLYGESFYRYLSERVRKEAVVDFRDYYIRNFFPFRTSEAMKSATGYSLNDFYNHWFIEKLNYYQEQKKIIEQSSLTVSHALENIGYNNWSPQWSKDGTTIYFVSQNPDRHMEIRAYNVNTGVSRRLKSVNIYETQISYDPSKQQILYSNIELERNYSFRNDIWSLDVKTGKSERITRSKRARNPAVHPSGKKIACITSNRGQTDLWEYDFATRQMTLLLQGGVERLLFNPAWSPDGSKIVLSIWQKGGCHDIWLFDCVNQTLQPLLQDKAWDIQPCWSNDSRFIIFCSDRTGVYNLFAYDLEFHRISQISNVISGAFDPVVSPDDRKIAFVGYSAKGFDIQVMDWNKEQPVNSYKALLGIDIKALPEFVYGYKARDQELGLENDSATVVTSPRKYNPFRLLLPGFYIPLPSLDEKGFALSVFTYGRDALAKHEYSLLVNPGLESRHIGYSLDYINRCFYPDISISIKDLVQPRDSYLIKNEKEVYWENQKELFAGIILPFQKLDIFHIFSFGLRFQNFTTRSSLFDNKMNPYFIGNLNNFEVRYDFSNAHQYPHSIGPVEGNQIFLLFNRYTKFLKSDINFNQLLIGWDKFSRLPFFKRHTIQMSGLWGRNDLQSGKQVENLSESMIRGFSAFTWKDKLYKARLEYHYPLVDIERSTPLLPIYIQKVHGSFFGEAAKFKNPEKSWRTIKSIGMELHLDLVPGYLISAELGLGVVLPFEEENNAPFYYISLGDIFFNNYFNQTIAKR